MSKQQNSNPGDLGARETAGVSSPTRWGQRRNVKPGSFSLALEIGWALTIILCWSPGLMEGPTASMYMDIPFHSVSQMRSQGLSPPVHKLNLHPISQLCVLSSQLLSVYSFLQTVLREEKPKFVHVSAILLSTCLVISVLLLSIICIYWWRLFIINLLICHLYTCLIPIYLCIYYLSNYLLFTYL